MSEEEFGEEPTIAPSDIKPDNLIPFPNLRPSTRLGKAWHDEVTRRTKETRLKLQLPTPLMALEELLRKRGLPRLPWPVEWSRLGHRARLYAGECCGVTGPSGGGKTSFALQVARAATAQGIPVLWNAKELDPPQLNVRIVANMMGLHTAQIHDDWSREQIKHSLTAIEDMWRYVENVRDQVGQLEAYRIAIRACKAVYRRAPLLVIDYMGKFASGEKDPRLAIMNAAEGVRELILAEDAYCLMLSQPSRSNNATLTGKVDLESATDALAVAGESSEIEFACSVMLGLNVFKRDDAEELDAHVLVSKARGSGREGREGFRFSKPGGVWNELPFLPSTPNEIALKHKEAASAAKKTKSDAPSKEQVRRDINAERDDDARAEYKRKVAELVRASGSQGTSPGRIRKVLTSSNIHDIEQTLQELERSQLLERIIGTPLRRWVHK